MKSQNRQLLEELFTLKKACESKDEELTELREKVFDLKRLLSRFSMTIIRFCRNLIIGYRLLLLKGLKHSRGHSSV